MKKIFLFLMFFFVTFINVYAEGSYVTAIKVDGNNLKDFASDNEGPYTINVESNKDKITLGYLYDKNMYDNEGSQGDITLNYGTNELYFKVTNKNDANDSKTYKINVVRPDNRSTDNSLSSLIVGNSKVVLTDANTYNVSVDSKTTSVEIKATPANGATLVDGYGERIGNNAVSITGQSASVEIRVKAENESVRTYTININKTDYKSNDATLKSLTLEGIDFDFKSNTYEYNLSVKYNVSQTKIQATVNNEKATTKYQENVNLKVGANDIEIKVTAEDGTEKTYKLNITREEEIPIVSNIEIEGEEFKFNPKTYSYKIETSLSELKFNITLRNETATSEISGNENLKNGSTIKIIAKDGEEDVTYSFKIVNKEEEKKEVIETVSNINNNDNFLKKNEMLIGLLIFGIGIFSTLAAIIVKRKVK